MTLELLPAEKTLTVTQLNRQIRLWLEYDVGEVSVTGEISNLSKPASGHFYFTLKDDGAQIRCVFFKNNHTRESYTYKDGQQVTARGKLSIYEPRGDYQLIVQEISAAGMGSLYQKFLELKQKLEKLGLFEKHRKKKLPLFPATIAIITSATGAAIRDILTTLERRYPLAAIHVYPTEVQGRNAAMQIIQAIKQANHAKQADVLILARGGGSIEDLWCFNDELLAMAISESQIPIVSGVGHETDFTIADFVADHRAATPTAAAECITPDKLGLLELLGNYEHRLRQAINKIIRHKQLILAHHTRTLTSPSHLVTNHWQSLDFMRQRLTANLQHGLRRQKHRLQLLQIALHNQNPQANIQQSRNQTNHLVQQLKHLIYHKLNQAKQQFESTLMHLNIVSPLATLERGYAIATHQNKVIFDSQMVNPGDKITVKLSKGQLDCVVLE